MTTTVCFHNNGTLDRRSFTMMGLSAKNDDSAVGFFGTGFKYAIATLIRNGADVCVMTKGHYNDTGYTVYKFSTEKSKFRNKELTVINCVVCNDVGDELERFEMPFTTHLGVNWKLWQAYRELYTNAVLDERGGIKVVAADEYVPEDVCIYVTHPEFMKVHEQHDKYFINDDKYETLAASRRMRMLPYIEGSDNVVYYKSMYTGSRTERQALFTYDYTIKMDLTEDRTLADVWYVKQHICDIWVQHLSYDMLVENLPRAANKDVLENDMSTYVEPSKQFIDACEYLIKHRRSMPIWAHDLYIKSRPFNEQYTQHTPTKYQVKMLKRAVAVLEHHECFVDIDKVVILVSLPEDLYGMYKEGTIYLAKQVFEKGSMTLLGTLYEEWAHQHHGCEDMTRNMQNILVDKIALLMEQVYETETDNIGVK